MFYFDLFNEIDKFKNKSDRFFPFARSCNSLRFFFSKQLVGLIVPHSLHDYIVCFTFKFTNMLPFNYF